MDARWAAGEAITLRYVGHHDLHERGRPGILQALPALVIEDSEAVLALWLPTGLRRRHADMADRSHVIEDEVWRLDTVRLMFPGAPYAVLLFWQPGTVGQREAFRGWYVNLEAPFVRTAIGVDTTDNSLDVLVRPDRSWRWKDEHLVQAWIDAGAYTRQETERIYAHGREAIARVEAAAFPFDGAYLDWMPPAGWGIPEVHPEWERLPGYDLTLTTGRRLTSVDPPR